MNHHSAPTDKGRSNDIWFRWCPAWRNEKYGSRSLLSNCPEFTSDNDVAKWPSWLSIYLRLASNCMPFGCILSISPCPSCPCHAYERGKSHSLHVSARVAAVLVQNRRPMSPHRATHCFHVISHSHRFPPPTVQEQHSTATSPSASKPISPRPMYHSNVKKYPTVAKHLRLQSMLTNHTAPAAHIPASAGWLGSIRGPLASPTLKSVEEDSGYSGWREGLGGVGGGRDTGQEGV